MFFKDRLGNWQFKHDDTKFIDGIDSDLFNLVGEVVDSFLDAEELQPSLIFRFELVNYLAQPLQSLRESNRVAD